MSTYTKLLNQILDYRFLHRPITTYLNLISLALVIDYYLNTLRLSWTYIMRYPYNPLLWKVLATQGEHHIWTVMGVLTVYMVLAYRIHKLGYRIWGVIAFFFFYTVISAHELLWWFSYDISHIFYKIPFDTSWLTNGSYWFPDLVTIVAFFYFYKYIKSKPIEKRIIEFNIPSIFFIFLVGFYIMWIAIGFPITIDFTGLTQWFYNPYVNGLEISSWIIPILIFLRTFRVTRPDMDSGLGDLTQRSIQFDPKGLTSNYSYRVD